MRRLSTVPEHLLTMMVPNTDHIFGAYLEMDEADVSWNAMQSFVTLVRKAKEASTNAYSWRGFRVGAMAYARDVDTSRTAMLCGFNIKPDSGEDTLNIHAEQMVIEKMRRARFGHIAALVVWGQPQADEQSGRLALTLHPCGLCRDFMTEAPEITSRTAILSCNQDFSICELYGLQDLQAYHAGSKPETEQFIRLNLSDSAIDQPDCDDQLRTGFLDAWTHLNPDHRYAPGLRQWLDAGQPTT